MADDFGMAVVNERLEVREVQAKQHVADAAFRARTAERQVRRRQILDVEALQHLADDAFCIKAALDHVRDRMDALDVLFKPCKHFIRNIRQRLEDEAASADAVEIGIDKDAEADGRRCLLRDIEVLREVVGNLAIRNFNAARDRVLEPREARDRYHAVCADAAADIDLAELVQRQVHMRLADRTAHEALGRRVSRDLSERSMAVKRDRQRLFILQVRREEQRTCHRAAERRCRDRVAVMTADSLIDEVRRDRRINAHALGRGFYEMILHTLTKTSLGL